MFPYFVGVPGVLSVQPDKNFESENKNYGGLSLSLMWISLSYISNFVCLPSKQSYIHHPLRVYILSVERIAL